MKRYVYSLLLPLTLSGCQAIGNWADSVGEHMPVISDRCEHWQCFTQSGQEQSEESKEKQASAPAEAAAVPAAQGAPNASAAPAAPTPYDMTPAELEKLPPPVTP